MDDAALMGQGEHAGDHQCDAQRLGALDVGQGRAKRVAFDQFEHQTVAVLALDDVIDVADVRRVELGEHTCLAQEAGPGECADALAGMYDLDRHGPLETLVPPAIDRAHSAGADEGVNADPTDPAAGNDVHGGADSIGPAVDAQSCAVIHDFRQEHSAMGDTRTFQRSPTWPSHRRGVSGTAPGEHGGVARPRL